jgi:hypothetical protein
LDTRRGRVRKCRMKVKNSMVGRRPSRLVQV